METFSRLGELWELSAEHFQKIKEYTWHGLYSITTSSPEINTLWCKLFCANREES